MAILKIRDAEGNVHEILALRGESYVLTEADKQEIAALVGGVVAPASLELDDYYTKEEIDNFNNNTNNALAQIRNDTANDLLTQLSNYYTKEEIDDKVSEQPTTETWTFTLEDGSTVNKTVVLK